MEGYLIDDKGNKVGLDDGKGGMKPFDLEKVFNVRPFPKEIVQRLNELTNEELRALHFILESLSQAKHKHPSFAKDDLMYASNILTEEVGEAAREFNSYLYEGGESLQPARIEVSQVGAVAIRLLSMMYTTKQKPKDGTNRKTKQTP